VPAPRDAQETLHRLQACYELELTPAQLSRVVCFGGLPNALMPGA